MKLNLTHMLPFFRQCLWTIPFIMFCAGYLSLQFFIGETTVSTPNFMGKNLLQATKISSDLQLNVRIIAEKEVPDAQPGTIIKQNPLPNASIKAHQSIFVVITKLPEPVIAPNVLGKSQQDIEKTCSAKGIKARFYVLPSPYPVNQCFAQIPAAHEVLEDKKMSCYVSTAHHKQALFPDFTTKSIHDVMHFLHSNNISYDIYHKNQKINPPLGSNLIVTYQKPLAGTIVTPHEKLYVQLQVM